MDNFSPIRVRQTHWSCTVATGVATAMAQACANAEGARDALAKMSRDSYNQCRVVTYEPMTWICERIPARICTYADYAHVPAWRSPAVRAKREKGQRTRRTSELRHRQRPSSGLLNRTARGQGATESNGGLAALVPNFRHGAGVPIVLPIERAASQGGSPHRRQPLGMRGALHQPPAFPRPVHTLLRNMAYACNNARVHMPWRAAPSYLGACSAARRVSVQANRAAGTTNACAWACARHAERRYYQSAANNGVGPSAHAAGLNFVLAPTPTADGRSRHATSKEREGNGGQHVGGLRAATTARSRPA